MFRGYTVELGDLYTDLDLSDCIDVGRKLHEDYKEQVQQRLHSFQDEDGNLIASQIIANWFPPVKANIFLSHSHKDEDAVLAFSGLLWKNFRLTSFIDSCIWGYSDDLLREIDNEYCYHSSRNTYSYDKRNRSTSHVHMMLSIAITKMIHNSECIMFVDTPNSISTEEYIKGRGMTDSPWIYSEISMTSLVQKRPPSEHRGRFVKAGRAQDSLTESFQIKYDVDTKHLAPLTSTMFASWQGCKKKGVDALDALYNLEDEDHEY